MHLVQPGAKINADYYIDHILKPFLSRDLRRGQRHVQQRSL